MLNELGNPGLWNYKIISPNQAKLRDAVEESLKNEEYIIQYP